MSVKPGQDYVLGCDFRLDIAVPAFHVQYEVLDEEGRSIKLTTLQRFEASRLWEHKTWPIKVTDLPPTARSIRLVFNWWRETGAPQGTAWVKEPFLGLDPLNSTRPRADFWDIDVSDYAQVDTWNTFQRDLKADLIRDGVRWDWVEFVILRLQVLGGEAGSGVGAYFDNIRTATTIVKRR
jgi:hypothetical protein